MMWTLRTSSNYVPMIFSAVYPATYCILFQEDIRDVISTVFIVSAAMNCLPSKKSACVDDIFIVPCESSWQLLVRQREIMVWSSTQQDIYLQINKIYFSYSLFNFSCFEHIESSPVISWFWKYFCNSLCGCFRFLASTSCFGNFS